MKNSKTIRIIHIPSGEVIAEGQKGWGLFAFEGNYYISSNNLKSSSFQFSGIPGLCPYKFLYFWYHFKPSKGDGTPMLGWKYWLPNPLFPFIAFRIAVPIRHKDILIEELNQV